MKEMAIRCIIFNKIFNIRGQTVDTLVCPKSPPAQIACKRQRDWLLDMLDAGEQRRGGTSVNHPEVCV